MVYRRGVGLKSVAVSQISIIIFSVFSFAFLLSEISFVSSQGPGSPGQFDGDELNGYNRPVEAQPPSNVAGFNAIKGAASSGKTVYFKGVEGINGYKDVAGYKTLPDGTNQLINSNGQVIKGYENVNPSDLQEVQKQVAGQGGSEVVEGSYQGSLGTTGALGHLAQGVSTALLVVGAIQLIGNLAGWDKDLTNTLSIAAGAGIMTTAAINAIGPTGANWGIYGGTNSFFATEYGPLTGAGWVGVAAAVVIFAVMYKKESSKVYNFQCLPYEAPVGGKFCEKCNEDPMRPCSEYRCRALGQACELVNVGTTDEKCVWVNPNDALSPTITPWDEVLTDNHRYTNHDTRPKSLGTKVAYNNNANGCLQAFTPLTFGILTNEPAQCKIDIDHKKTMDEMQFFFGNNNLYTYNHSQTFSLPSPDALNTEAPELKADGKYDFFVRCRDKNGNENVDEYAIQLCVDPSPDTTAPVIVDSSIPTESYVKYGVQSVGVQFYLNEPSSCKWSTQDKSYEVMENTMRCAESLTQINARELYACSTNFTGIVDRQTNDFYVRCKDQPSKPEEDRNVNVASYKYTLRGSQPLNIIYTSPNGTVTGNTNTVPVEIKIVTDDGANEGVAICSFSSTGAPNSYVVMFETRDVEHKQRLDLGTGNYNYKIRCVDFGGNAAEAELSFNVLVDTNAPLITRAYRDLSNNALKIVTNEDALCEYSLNSCNFNFKEGIELLYISTSNKKSHYAEWKPNSVYYIKCKDIFGNEPGPNTCSLVASATNLK